MTSHTPALVPRRAGHGARGEHRDSEKKLGSSGVSVAKKALVGLRHLGDRARHFGVVAFDLGQVAGKQLGREYGD